MLCSVCYNETVRCCKRIRIFLFYLVSYAIAALGWRRSARTHTHIASTLQKCLFILFTFRLILVFDRLVVLFFGCCLPCLCTNYLKWQRRIWIALRKWYTTSVDQTSPSFHCSVHNANVWPCMCFTVPQLGNRGNEKEMPLNTQNRWIVDLSINNSKHKWNM